MKGNPTAIRAIKKAMEDYGLNQTHMADVFGSRSRSSEILNGKRGLTVQMIARLHWWLGIPFEELIAKPRRVIRRPMTPEKPARAIVRCPCCQALAPHGESAICDDFSICERGGCEWNEAERIVATLPSHERRSGSAGQWLPISEAPKDGRNILVPGGIAYWRERLNHWDPPDGWYTITGFDWPGRAIQWDVLHWMPMPDMPLGYRHHQEANPPPPGAGEDR